MSEDCTPAAGWLVVGVGRHVDRLGLPALSRARGAEPVALCGTDPERTAELAERHGVRLWGPSPEELLEDPRITHVYVCSRNDSHERHVALAAAAGKHVLCEKPLAGTAAEAERIVAVCEQYGVALGTGFHLRHSTAHREAKRLIGAGVIGRPLWVDVTYLHELGHDDSPARLGRSRATDTPSRGAMAGTGMHAADLAQWLAGDPIHMLTATLAELDPTGAGPQRVLQVSGVTGRGALVTFAAGRATHPANSVTVTGEEGRITVADSIGSSGGGRLSVRSAAQVASSEFPAHDVYTAQFEHFAASAAKGRSPEASGGDGLSALRIGEAVDRALILGDTQTVAATLNEGAL